MSGRGLGRSWSWWRGFVLASLLFGTIPTTPAHADEIEKIELTPNGPKSALPLRGKFYLTGKVPANAEQVRAIFIRYRWGPLGIGPAKQNKFWPNSCSEVLAALPDKGLVTKNQSGLYQVQDLWPSSPSGSDQAKKHYKRLRGSEHRVYLPPPWKKSADGGEGEANYEILVSKPSFFRPGARFCLLMVSEGKEPLSDKTRNKLLADYREEFSTCVDEVKPEEPDATKQKKLNKCATDAMRHLLVSLQPQLKGGELEQTVKALVDGKSDGPLSLVTDLALAQKRLSELAKNWRQHRRPFRLHEGSLQKTKGAGDQLDATSLAGAYLEVDAAHPLARLILLHFHRNKGRVYRPSVDRFTISDPGHKLAVGGKEKIVDVTADVSKVRVFFGHDGTSVRTELEGSTTIDSVNVTVKHDGDPLTKMQYPLHDPKTATDDALTLEDVVQFLGGRVRIGKDRFVAIEALSKQPNLFASDTAKVKEPARKLANLTEDLLRAFEEIEKVHDSALPTEHAQELARLVEETGALVPCNDPKSKADAKRCVAKDAKDAKERWWPGYAREANNCPLAVLALRLKEIADAAEGWEENGKTAFANALTRETKKYSGTATELEIAMTQKAFIHSYLTEVAGINWLPTENGDTATGTVGLQLFLYPNEVDEPMWSNGALDFRRLIGLELSLRPNGKKFGRDDRYGPLPDAKLPPFFAGFVVQPLPYTTIGTGVAVFGYRKSPLEQERSRVRAVPYLNAAAEFNIAAIIQRLASGTKPAIVTSATSPSTTSD